MLAYSGLSSGGGVPTVGLLLFLRSAIREFRCPEKKTWETGQEDGDDLLCEDLRMMQEMWSGAAALGRREGRRGREREKLGECINLGYLPLPDRGMIVMAGGERRHGRLRRVRDLAWASRESSREVRGLSASPARDTLIKLQDTVP